MIQDMDSLRRFLIENLTSQQCDELAAELLSPVTKSDFEQFLDAMDADNRQMFLRLAKEVTS